MGEVEARRVLVDQLDQRRPKTTRAAVGEDQLRVQTNGVLETVLFELCVSEDGQSNHQIHALHAQLPFRRHVRHALLQHRRARRHVAREVEQARHLEEQRVRVPLLALEGAAREALHFNLLCVSTSLATRRLPDSMFARPASSQHFHRRLAGQSCTRLRKYQRYTSRPKRVFSRYSARRSRWFGFTRRRCTSVRRIIWIAT